MRTKLILCLSSLALFMSAVQSNAQQVFERITSIQLQQVFQEEGYTFEVDEDGDIVWKIDGIKTLVMRSEKGDNLIFRVSFHNDKTTMAMVNKWNQTKRYSRSYLDEDGDPVLDLDLEGGVTKKRLVDFLLTCRLSYGAWAKEVL